MSSAANELPMSASVRRAQRVALARALEGLTLDWADIDISPYWLTLPDNGARKRLCASAGAWWLMASLRACIDGKRLARVRDLLGDEFLARLHESNDVELLNQAPRPLLLPAEDMAAHLLTCGRALLSWSLEPQLRVPVQQRFGWNVDERHYKFFDEHTVWAHHALEAAQQENLPAAPHSCEPGTSE